MLTSFDIRDGRGHRHVVRHRLPDGSATDTIGYLDAADEQILTLTPIDGSTVTVRCSAVLAIKRVSDAPGGPPPGRTTPAELERIAAQGWVADHEPLGEWLLRSGDGFTGRANSTLAVGDPGLPVPDAAAAIGRYSQQHGIPPLAQVIVGSAEDAALTALGWRETYETTDVLTTRLSTLLDRASAPAGDAVTVDPCVSAGWLDAYRGYRTWTAPDATVRRILAGGGLASVQVEGRLAALGRAHVVQGWTGISALWTHPDHRRRGLATTVLLALGRWAARQGARNAYLQLAQSNPGAHAAYARLGFTLHHTYRYLAPPLLGRGAAADPVGG